MGLDEGKGERGGDIFATLLWGSNVEADEYFLPHFSYMGKQKTQESHYVMMAAFHYACHRDAIGRGSCLQAKWGKGEGSEETRRETSSMKSWWQFFIIPRFFFLGQQGLEYEDVFLYFIFNANSKFFTFYF